MNWITIKQWIVRNWNLTFNPKKCQMIIFPDAWIDVGNTMIDVDNNKWLYLGNDWYKTIN